MHKISVPIPGAQEMLDRLEAALATLKLGADTADLVTYRSVSAARWDIAWVCGYLGSALRRDAEAV